MYANRRCDLAQIRISGALVPVICLALECVMCASLSLATTFNPPFCSCRLRQAAAQAGQQPGSEQQSERRRKAIQEQLLLLIHAHKCKDQTNSCTIAHCGTMKEVLKHMSTCKRGRNCQYATHHIVLRTIRVLMLNALFLYDGLHNAFALCCFSRYFFPCFVLTVCTATWTRLPVLTRFVLLLSFRVPSCHYSSYDSYH